MPPKRSTTKKTSKKKTSRRSSSDTLPTSPSMTATGPEDYIMLFFGPPGVGKTTFVNNLGRVLFLSTDRGTRFLEAMRMECNNWDDLEKALTKVEAACKRGDRPYDYICIDHVADWANMAEAKTLEKLGIDALTDAGFGKGWSEYKKMLEKFMQRVKALDMGIIFIAHEVTKTVKVRGLEVDKVMPSMSKSAWNAVIPLSDLVGYIGMRPVKKGGKRVEIRTLETEPRQDLYAKDRTRRQKPTRDYAELDGDKFIHTFS